VLASHGAVMLSIGVGASASPIKYMPLLWASEPEPSHPSRLGFQAGAMIARGCVLGFFRSASIAAWRLSSVIMHAPSSRVARSLGV
jgi:hypothetical protein